MVINERETEILLALAEATTEEEKDCLSAEWNEIIRFEIEKDYAAHPNKPKHSHNPEEWHHFHEVTQSVVTKDFPEA